MKVAEPLLDERHALITPQRRTSRLASNEPTQKPRRAVSLTLVVVLLVGLILRLGVAAWLHGEKLHVADEQDYDALAFNIAKHGEFAIDQGRPTSIRPPLFPAMVAGIYRLAGEHNFSAVRLVNAVLGTMTAFVVYVLARRLYDQRVGLLAAAICAFYPSLIATTGLVLTETLFALLVGLCCLMMERYLKTASVKWLAAFSAVLGIAALTRSVLWLFPAPLVLFLLACGPELRLSRRVLHVGVALIAFAAVLAPWTIRNTQLQQTFITVDVMGGRNFMMGNYDHTPFDRPWAAIEVSGEKAWHQVLRQRYPDEFHGLTQGKIDKLAMKYAIQYILAHPGETLVRDLAKLAHFWQLEREIAAGLMRGYWGGLPKPAILAAAGAIIGVYVVVMLMGVVGAANVPPANWRMHLFVLLLIAFVWGIHTLVFGHSRYHLPLMPLVGMYAAAGVIRWREVVQQMRGWTGIATGCVCLALVAYWSYELLVEAVRF